MRYPSRISACRRELNSHEAAKPRSALHLPQRTAIATPQAREPTRSRTTLLSTIEVDGNYLLPSHRAGRAHHALSTGYQSVGGAAELSTSTVPKLLRAVGKNAWRARVASAERDASVVHHLEKQGTGTLTTALQPQQRCLTRRSSRAPTAGHAGPVGGTLYIFANRARASHRWCRLTSNVRQHKLQFPRPTSAQLLQAMQMRIHGFAQQSQ
jgi:hypothetical protein